MDPQVTDISPLAINEIPEVKPVDLPDPTVTVLERLARIETDLNLD